MHKLTAIIVLVAAAVTPIRASARGEEALRKAAALAGDNKIGDALNLLTEASRDITAGPESARIWHEIGAAHERLGDEPRAIGAYWRAIELAESAGDAAQSTALASLWNLGTIYLKHGEVRRLDPIFDRYRQMSARLPSGGTADASYRIRFALLFQGAHRYGEAEILYKEGIGLLRAVSAKPELAFGLSNLASLLSSESRHREAVACIREALAIARSVPVPLDKIALLEINLAATYLQSGDVPDAMTGMAAAATTMHAGETSLETRLAFYWTSANLSRKMHRKHDAAAYMTMWKSLSGGSVGADVPAAVDAGELRAAQGH